VRRLLGSACAEIVLILLSQSKLSSSCFSSGCRLPPRHERALPDVRDQHPERNLRVGQRGQLRSQVGGCTAVEFSLPIACKAPGFTRPGVSATLPARGGATTSSNPWAYEVKTWIQRLRAFTCDLCRLVHVSTRRPRGHIRRRHISTHRPRFHPCDLCRYSQGVQAGGGGPGEHQRPEVFLAGHPARGGDGDAQLRAQGDARGGGGAVTTSCIHSPKSLKAPGLVTQP
jgi:hypothetical protein